MKVGVVDYSVGNLGSMARTLEEVGAQPMLISLAADLSAPDCLILPRVRKITRFSKASLIRRIFTSCTVMPSCRLDSNVFLR
jgi:imidazoleglycerol phosphate synthase glutamine amidotransferase subunit HisH